MSLCKRLIPESLNSTSLKLYKNIRIWFTALHLPSLNIDQRQTMFFKTFF